MPTISRRDARAIAFCLVTVAGVLLAALVVTESALLATIATGGYAALLLAHPRIQRVIRRLSRDPSYDFRGYIED